MEDLKTVFPAYYNVTLSDTRQGVRGQIRVYGYPTESSVPSAAGHERASSGVKYWSGAKRMMTREELHEQLDTLLDLMDERLLVKEHS